MIIIIASTITFAASVAVYVSQSKRLKVAQVRDDELNECFKPLDEITALLDTKKESYTKLQKLYKKELDELKAGERVLAQHQLGVGSVDNAAYTSLSKSDDLSTMECELAEVKDQIKAAVKAKTACICRYGNDVVVNGKRSEAKKLFNREIKLRLRCLDNDVKSAIALAEWNNINRLVERILSAYNEINESGKIVKTYIQPRYLDLKVVELRLTFEVSQLKADLKEEEREERRRIREAEREEEKIKVAAKKAHADRARMEALVKEELTKLQGDNQEQRELLEQHQRELAVLKEKENRAVSMAQLTRSGYVYIISNPMSFGEGVCKIGMTRRVNPNERVRELGDASVPDLFTVHGFIFSEDAPALEKRLHTEFESQRLNLVNKRKEFFLTDPQLVLDTVQKLDPKLKIE